jgi:hypothetical protein
MSVGASIIVGVESHALCRLRGRLVLYILSYRKSRVTPTNNAANSNIQRRQHRSFLRRLSKPKRFCGSRIHCDLHRVSFYEILCRDDPKSCLPFPPVAAQSNVGRIKKCRRSNEFITISGYETVFVSSVHAMLSKCRGIVHHLQMSYLRLF